MLFLAALDFGAASVGRVLLVVGVGMVLILLVQPPPDPTAFITEEDHNDKPVFGFAADLANGVRIGAFIAGVAGFLYRGLPGGLIAAALVVGGYFFWLSKRDAKRRSMFEDQLPELLQMVSGSMRSATSLLQALEVVSREAPQPMSDEITRVLYESRLGTDIGISLDALGDRMESKDFGWIVGAIEIHRDVGGDLAEIFDRIGETIRNRNRVREQMKALSAEGKMSGWVLGLMPPGVFLVLGTVNPEYMGTLTSSTTGWIALGSATGLLVVGVLWLQRLARFDF